MTHIESTSPATHRARELVAEAVRLLAADGRLTVCGDLVTGTMVDEIAVASTDDSRLRFLAATSLNRKLVGGGSPVNRQDDEPTPAVKRLAALRADALAQLTIKEGVELTGLSPGRVGQVRLGGRLTGAPRPPRRKAGAPLRNPTAEQPNAATEARIAEVLRVAQAEVDRIVVKAA